jgi:hypothetical protein
MNLQRIRQLAGIKLTEGVQAVPGVGQQGGSESDMQSSTTAANNQAYAGYAAAHPPATEEDEMIESVVDEKAPPGMEDMVMKLKKEYPGHPEKAFATAWSIYDKKHGKKEENVEMNEISQDLRNKYLDKAITQHGDANFTARQTTGPEHDYYSNLADKRNKGISAALNDRRTGKQEESVGCGMEEDHMYQMEEGESNPKLKQATDLFTSLVMNSFVPPEDAYDRVMAELADQGDSELMPEFDSWLEQQGFASGEDDEDPNTNEINVNRGEGPGYESDQDYRDNEFEEAIAGWGFEEEVEEAFDLQNGYDDINDACGNDYFPSGADSPVVGSTGDNSREGDNPEQKRLAVTEVHKELVYSYRKYLGENKR